LNPRLLDKLSRMYPSCTRREVEQLAASMDGDKYWRGPKMHVFAVALTRARNRAGGGRFARATGVGTVWVPERLAKFCRKGKVLLILTEAEPMRTLAVLSWPAFLYVMRRRNVEKLVHRVSSSGIDVHIDVRSAKRMLNANET